MPEHKKCEMPHGGSLYIAKYYAIRRKSDGFVIPEPSGRNGRGGSFAEPIDPTDDAFKMRIFYSERSAKIALNTWLKGEFHFSSETTYDWEGNRDDYETVNIVSKPERKKEDMEVFPVKLMWSGKV